MLVVNMYFIASLIVITLYSIHSYVIFLCPPPKKEKIGKKAKKIMEWYREA